MCRFCETYGADNKFGCINRPKPSASPVGYAKLPDDIPKFKALELDTGEEVKGYYYAENGYWMDNGIPDYSKPVRRHRIVDADGMHREIAEDTIQEA